MSAARPDNNAPQKELREQIRKEIEAKFKVCSNPTYHCTVPRLDGNRYCLRHILRDPRSAYRQCTYIFSTGKKCTNALLKHDTKKDPALTTFCFEHSRKAQLQKTRASVGKLCRSYTNEVYLQNLVHHLQIDEMSEKTPDGDQDEEIDVVSPHVVPFVSYDQIQTLSGVEAAIKKRRRILDYASDNSCEVDEPVCLNSRARCLEYEQSDPESGTSDTEDVLKHNGIFSREEAIRISIKKLTRLQGLYMEQVHRLNHILKDERRRYLQGIRKERELYCNIQEQVKDNPKERQMYEELRALSNYHRRFGPEALLYKKFKEKRACCTDTYGFGYLYSYGYGYGHASKGPSSTKCVFTEGGVKCAERTVPCTKFCRKHILEDKKQIFFRACGVEKNGVLCQTPIPTIFDGATCILHLSVPTFKQYAQKKHDSESDDEPEFDNKSSVLLNPNKCEQQMAASSMSRE